MRAVDDDDAGAGHEPEVEGVAEVRVENAEPACGLGKGVDEVAVAGGVDADVLELGDYGKGLTEEGDEAVEGGGELAVAEEVAEVELCVLVGVVEGIELAVDLHGVVGGDTGEAEVVGGAVGGELVCAGEGDGVVVGVCELDGLEVEGDEADVCPQVLCRHLCD